MDGTSANRLPVRRVNFEYPDDLSPAWNKRFPEFSYAANAVSLIMPYAEPFFIRTVRAALPQLDDDLAAVTEDWARQESRHYSQHRRFNNLIAERYPHIQRVEGWEKRTYAWLSRTRSLNFNIALIAASETVAFAVGRWAEKHLGELFDDTDPVPATLFLWHLAEEVEHKNAAYDVFEAVDGSRLRYLAAAFTTLTSFAFFVWAGTLSMLRAEGRLFSPVAHFRLARWAISIGFVVLPLLAVSSLPGHSPREFTNPVYLPAWLGQYDPVTATMPIWHGGSASSTAA